MSYEPGSSYEPCYADQFQSQEPRTLLRIRHEALLSDWIILLLLISACKDAAGSFEKIFSSYLKDAFATRSVIHLPTQILEIHVLNLKQRFMSIVQLNLHPGHAVNLYPRSRTLGAAQHSTAPIWWVCGSFLARAKEWSDAVPHLVLLYIQCLHFHVALGNGMDSHEARILLVLSSHTIVCALS